MAGAASAKDGSARSWRRCRTRQRGGRGSNAPAGASPSSTRPSSIRSFTAREMGSSARPSWSPRPDTVMPPPTATSWRQWAASTVTSSPGSSARSDDPGRQRGHDGLDGLPLLEHGLGRGQGVLDLGGCARRGGGGVVVEDEVALLEAQQLEQHVGGPVGQRRPRGLAAHDGPAFEPQRPRSVGTGQAQPTRLVGRRQQAQDVRKGKGFERALKSHDDLRKGDERLSIGSLAHRNRGPFANLVPVSGADHDLDRRRLAGPQLEGHRRLAHQHPQPVEGGRTPALAAAWSSGVSSGDMTMSATSWPGTQPPRLHRQANVRPCPPRWRSPPARPRPGRPAGPPDRPPRPGPRRRRPSTRCG